MTALPEPDPPKARKSKSEWRNGGKAAPGSSSPSRRTLYFDLDGTLLHDSRPKRALAGGVFETAVREAGFTGLVCVGSIVGIIQFLHQLGKAPDSHKMILDLCGDLIKDKVWFRRVTSIVPSADNRARYIDFESDWWYLDDMARYFMEKDGMLQFYERNLGQRVFSPAPEGDGTDVLNWLSTRVK